MDGVTLLAIGNKSYSQWAFNMALSIKYHNKDIPIQLIHDPKTTEKLSEWHMSFFDIKTEINKRHYIVDNRFNPAWAKLNLNNYVAFDKSLCMDVDAICLKDVSPIFSLDRYHVQTKGYMARHVIPDDVEIWAHPNKVWDRYLLNEDTQMPIVETGLQLIIKDDYTRDIFNKARMFFSDPIPIDELKGSWGWNQPDELYLGVAMATLNYRPDFPDNVKSLHATYKEQIVNEVQYCEPYYCFGLWGNKALNHSRLIGYYDRLMTKYSKRWERNIEFKARKLLNDKFVKINKKQK